jgi:hypothetical protein
MPHSPQRRLFRDPTAVSTRLHQAASSDVSGLSGAARLGVSPAHRFLCRVAVRSRSSKCGAPAWIRCPDARSLGDLGCSTWAVSIERVSESWNGSVGSMDSMGSKWDNRVCTLRSGRSSEQGLGRRRVGGINTRRAAGPSSQSLVPSLRISGDQTPKLECHCLSWYLETGVRLAQITWQWDAIWLAWSGPTVPAASPWHDPPCFTFQPTTMVSRIVYYSVTTHCVRGKVHAQTREPPLDATGARRKAR